MNVRDVVVPVPIAMLTKRERTHTHIQADHIDFFGERERSRMNERVTNE